MGYTHYFELKRKATEEEIEKVLEEVKNMVKHLPKSSPTAGGYYSDDPLKICGGMGVGKPTFSKEMINFNGDESEGLDHETFHIEFNKPKWDFCKTARKPYDMLVCLCLISLKNNIEGFTFSSDGVLDDWEPAFEFYRKHIGNLNFETEAAFAD